MVFQHLTVYLLSSLLWTLLNSTRVGYHQSCQNGHRSSPIVYFFKKRGIQLNKIVFLNSKPQCIFITWLQSECSVYCTIFIFRFLLFIILREKHLSNFYWIYYYIFLYFRWFRWDSYIFKSLQPRKRCWVRLLGRWHRHQFGDWG